MEKLDIILKSIEARIEKTKIAYGTDKIPIAPALYTRAYLGTYNNKGKAYWIDDPHTDDDPDWENWGNYSDEDIWENWYDWE